MSRPQRRPGRSRPSSGWLSGLQRDGQARAGCPDASPPVPANPRMTCFTPLPARRSSPAYHDATPLHSPGAAPISPAPSTNKPTSEGKSYPNDSSRQACCSAPASTAPPPTPMGAIRCWQSPIPPVSGERNRNSGRGGGPRVDLERARRDPRRAGRAFPSSTRGRSGPAARWGISSRTRNGAASGAECR